ncbi:hypothetical protein IM40_03420 [Candidatus Paracaedimonas acanthamoebae]|nr:hypothetical protein IM40_03420 [Candidatus Paracaedimonas acanthamoebae]
MLLSLIAVLGLNTPDQTSSTLSAFNLLPQEKPISFLITRRETINLKGTKRHFFYQNTSLFLPQSYKFRPHKINFGFTSQFKWLKDSHFRLLRRNIVFNPLKKIAFFKIKRRIISYLNFQPPFKLEKELTTKNMEEHTDFTPSFLSLDDNILFSLDNPFFFNAVNKTEEAFSLEKKRALDLENVCSDKEKTFSPQISQNKLAFSSMPRQERTYTPFPVIIPGSIAKNSEETPALTIAPVVPELALLSIPEDRVVSAPVAMATISSTNNIQATLSLNSSAPISSTPVLPSLPASSSASTPIPVTLTTSSTHSTMAATLLNLVPMVPTPVLSSTPVSSRTSTSPIQIASNIPGYVATATLPVTIPSPIVGGSSTNAQVLVTVANPLASNTQSTSPLNSGALTIPTPALPSVPVNSSTSTLTPAPATSSSTHSTMAATPFSAVSVIQAAVPSSMADQSSDANSSLAEAGKSSKHHPTSTTTSSSAPPLDGWVESKGHIQTTYDSLLRQAGITSISSSLVPPTLVRGYNPTLDDRWTYSKDSMKSTLDPFLIYMERHLRSTSPLEKGSISCAEIEERLATSLSPHQTSAPTSLSRPLLKRRRTPIPRKFQTSLEASQRAYYERQAGVSSSSGSAVAFPLAQDNMSTTYVAASISSEPDSDASETASSVDESIAEERLAASSSSNQASTSPNQPPLKRRRTPKPSELQKSIADTDFDYYRKQAINGSAATPTLAQDDVSTAYVATSISLEPAFDLEDSPPTFKLTSHGQSKSKGKKTREISDVLDDFSRTRQVSTKFPSTYGLKSPLFPSQQDILYHKHVDLLHETLSTLGNNKHPVNLSHDKVKAKETETEIPLTSDH